MKVEKVLAYMICILVILGVGAPANSIIAYAKNQQQSPGFPPGCPSPDTVKELVNYLNAAILVVIIAIVLLVVLFNMFGTVSSIAMRLGEFFTERIRFVFELLLIYILFIWNLANAIPESSKNGCATIDWNQLFNSGPLFFQIVGWLLKLLGFQLQ